MARAILAIIALAILAMVAVTAFQASLETAGDDTTITNETFVPDAGNITVLDDSTRTGAYYTHNVTVYDDTGTEMDPGTDYTWYPGNGTVKALTGGSLDGAPSALITYGYQQTTREQRRFAALLGQLPRMMGLALPVGAFLLLVALFRGAV